MPAIWSLTASTSRGPRVRASGTGTATSMSITPAAMALCCLATAGRRSLPPSRMPCRRRHAPRCQPRARSPLGADRARACAVRGAGALHILRHRGDPHGAPPRPRPYRQEQDRALQGSLPRLARSHDLRLHLALRRVADGGRAARPRSPGDPAAARRSGSHARRLRGRRRYRGGDPGADRRLLRPRAPCAGVSRLPAGAHGDSTARC